MAILPSETLGPDDLLEIMVSYCPELSRSFRVGSDGSLSLPLIHQKLMVAGLTPSQLTKVLQDTLTHENIMAEPTVNISVLEYRSRPVSVSGAVKSPLTFQATGRTTLLDAIAKAGGVSPTAGGNVVVTTKAEPVDGKVQNNVQTIAMKALLSGNQPQLNLELHGGEEIRIAEASKVFVTGDVRRPGMYPMQGDEVTTVVKAIALGEGLDTFSASEAYIYRRHDNSDNREEIKVPLSRIMSRKAPDVPLLADDILYIPTSNGKRLTSKVLSQLAGFGQSAGSGLLIYR
ncbi:SLBB domain-containing protein [Granulicella sp. WH15]|uniref:SLBB domain-containing protein n=1 Tax=Granulicella sp. WH15 TaxID=2602070 RepID=UPI0013A576B1|nr:SLBB domain-containing protein [Granulicella sp. WH15]